MDMTTRITTTWLSLALAGICTTLAFAHPGHEYHVEGIVRAAVDGVENNRGIVEAKKSN